MFEVKGNSNYQFYSHKFDWLEELLSQLEIDSSIIYKVTPISIEEEFALKPIPKDRAQTYRLTNKIVRKEISEKIRDWKKPKRSDDV